MKTTVQLEFDSPEAAIEALARVRGITGAATAPAPAKELKAPKFPKETAGTPPSAAVETASTPAAAPSPPPAPAPAPAPAAASTVPPLQVLADLVGQGVNKNRDGTIEVLAGFGAKKASQVPEDKREEAITAMKALLTETADLAG